MTSFPKTSYLRPLVPNSESVDKTTNPYFKNPRVPIVAENEAYSVLVKHIFQCAPVFLCSQQFTKILKKLVSEIFKRTISGKPYAKEAPRIERCVNTNIQ